MLKNIRWRLDNEVDTLTFKTLPSELFDSPFVFFHKQDKLQRPILVINVQYLPKYDSSVFVEKLRPFMILIMEMARKLTRDITMVREDRGEELPLVQDLVIVVNLANAGRVPMVLLKPILHVISIREIYADLKFFDINIGQTIWSDAY